MIEIVLASLLFLTPLQGGLDAQSLTPEERIELERKLRNADTTLLERTGEKAQEISENPWTSWAIKFLVAGEAAFIFWLYKLIKSEEAQRKILEGVQSAWGRENAEESTHRRFAILLNALGQEVLYIAQGDLESVMRLSKDQRLLLFFRQENEGEEVFFVKKIDGENVFAMNSEKENVEIPLNTFFKKKNKFSFIVFLSTKSFYEGCNFFNVHNDIVCEREEKE